MLLCHENPLLSKFIMIKDRFLMICAIVCVSQCPNSCPDKQYFGPECRYLNLRHTARHVTVNDAVTVSGSDCYSVAETDSHGTVKVNLEGERHITWVRVDLKNETGTREVDVKLLKNGNILTKGWEKRFISGFTVDVEFDVLDEFITHVVVEGHIQSTCDVYVSQGQNLPRNYQKWAVSSQNEHNGEAFRCVNGDLTDHCSTRGSISEEVWWKFIFPFPADVYRISLDNNHSSLQDRQAAIHHSLSIHYHSQRETFLMDDDTDFDKTEYDYNVNSYGAPAVMLKIIPHHPVDNIKRLIFREIYIWGDYICDGSKFGPDCQHTCNCLDPNEQCFKNTGGCPGGCAEGYEGTNCSVMCGLFNFGINCSQACPQCVTGCDNVLGDCNYCYAGYQGEMCDEECPGGRYGPSCKYKCSPNCLSPGCHPANGSCEGFQCRKGWTGSKCSETCLGGLWGDKCQSECSENCAGESGCDPVDGKCKEGCKYGYEPPRCVDKKINILKVVVFLIVLLLLFFGALFLCRQVDDQLLKEDFE